ncbi:NACHT domain-containing protein [Streptomyces sp. DSM 44917]|uniref:NACHT domain-containing protein n=1 Tax=Streptomyces boetiae TaxID=3075541 RepID=A0ABU2LFY0_9ACTN|nr:NACHT domain-containing protein [Streptomyces sp. DSM 44917]MDT0310365.1 NACHT domain-containing protein [Streptomyces sp. DSM 44917]
MRWSRGREWGRWALEWTAAPAAVGMAAAWPGNGPGAAAAVASLVAAATGLAGLLAGWARAARRPAPDPRQLAAAADLLARLVRRQWEAEAELRQLTDPAPLPVAWRDCRLPGVADHAELTGGPFAVRADEPDALARAFLGLPRRRLVLAGAAGSGKTTLAVLLTLALLRARRGGTEVPVPVPLPLASFDPAREAPLRWLVRRLTADYPALADTASFGHRAVEELVREGAVLPVLDGLDELPPGARAAALRALRERYPAAAPLVLTCRTDVYAAAVVRAGLLPGAAVAEPAPVRTADALDLLRLATPPGPRQRGWDRLAAHLARDPAGPAAVALSAPLVVALARAVYAGPPPAGDPAELADRGRFPTAEAIEDHLLDRLVPALYGRAGHPEPERAGLHLAGLARCLEGQGTQEFAWWRLYRSVPALAAAWSRALLWSAAGTALVLPPLLWGWRTAAGQAIGGSPAAALPWAWYFFATVLALQVVAAALPRGAGGPATVARAVLVPALAVPAGLLAALAARPLLPAADVPGQVGPVEFFGPSAGETAASYLLLFLATGVPAPPAAPSRAGFALRRRGLGRGLARTAGVALAVSVPLALSVAWVSGRRLVPAPEDWRAAVVIAALLAAGVAALRWVRTPGSAEDVTTLRASVRGDRRMCAVHSACCLALALVPPLTARALHGDLPGPFAVLRPAAAVAVLFYLVPALAASAWPHWVLARAALAVRGRLPWRAGPFLAEAHRLGVLRRSGPAYQFRHARLQRRLAARAGSGAAGRRGLPGGGPGREGPGPLSRSRGRPA